MAVKKTERRNCILCLTQNLLKKKDQDSLRHPKTKVGIKGGRGHGHVGDDAGEETTFASAEEEPGGQNAAVGGDEALEASDETPRGHDEGQDSVRAELLDGEGDGVFGDDVRHCRAR